MSQVHHLLRDLRLCLWPTNYVLRSFMACIWLMWAGAAAAAAAVIQQRPTFELDLVLLAMGTLLSTLAGATALAIRINNLLMGDTETGEPRPLVKPWLFASAHMGGSWTAGAAGFLWGRSSQWDVWMSLFVVLVFSFAGSKVLEMLAERLVSNVQLPGAQPKAGKG